MLSTTHVLLIRHGQSQGNAEGRFGGHTDTPLSPRGRKQAAATARALASEKFDAIYSSDLPRAIETASPLAKLTGVALETTEALRERSVGVMEGLTFEEAAEQHPEQYQALLKRDFEHVLSGGESYRQMLDRASRKLDEVIEQHQGGRIAIFTHTGAICILILHIMGALDAPELKPVWIATANCGIARFDLRSDGFIRVVTINDTRHLVGI
ncbi:MAG TPA: histidine phosphatase family protein [Blastocatellia bacterium]|jgi:broad specificity phosphatase PhoE|nr:histidine phosphatase family protein [Blastocatellia bacterium]HAF23606.1 histidine phosphatase family protein [Blastocatellia bacterium]HCX31721.1 histidine phosphatase family protein [Blastocatellia bacterium]